MVSMAGNTVHQPVPATNDIRDISKKMMKHTPAANLRTFCIEPSNSLKVICGVHFLQFSTRAHVRCGACGS